MIGTDVGGTKIAVSLVDANGNILGSIRRPTDVKNPEATLDSIAKAVLELIKTEKLELNNYEALGFGIPGLVDPERGIGIASVNLGWQNVAVQAGLESRLGVRCLIDNDVRNGALGEARFGVARGLRNLVYLNIGTGVSVVILMNGKFLMGVHGLAGEIGHAVLIPDGPLCKCGGKGCLEAVVSGPGIAERALGKIKAGRSSILTSKEAENSTTQLTAEQVFNAASRNDEVALTTLVETSELLAYSLEYIALAYDPDMIVIGGSVGLGSRFLFDKVQRKLQELADSSWVFGKVYSKDLVKLSTLGNNAGVLGAAALVSSEVN